MSAWFYSATRFNAEGCQTSDGPKAEGFGKGRARVGCPVRSPERAGLLLLRVCAVAFATAGALVDVVREAASAGSLVEMRSTFLGGGGGLSGCIAPPPSGDRQPRLPSFHMPMKACGVPSSLLGQKHMVRYLPLGRW
jgi:hypothetical protein